MARTGGLGKKVGGTLTTGYLYQDALNVVAQLDANGNVVGRFVYATKPNVPDYYTTSSGVVLRIISYHLGSPRVVVNASTCAVAEQIDSDDFGNATNDTAPGTIPFGFAGGLSDKDTGLVRFGARDYDPSTGRWTTKDPVRLRGGFNLYRYAVSDPVNRQDPSGRSPIAIPWWLIAGGEGGEGGSILGPIGAAVGAAIGLCLAASASDDDGCKAEWRAAYERCANLITNPTKNSSKLAGGHQDLPNCAKGFVSQRCGGNLVTPEDSDEDDY
jgi:RHS repeat-associated protein